MFKHFLNESLKYTDEMEDWFEKRTKKHIERVQKWAGRIEKLDSKFKGLSERAKEHDKSKFGRIEKIPYIFVSWNYHQKALGKKFEVTDEMKEAMHNATLHHIHNNRHHPEYFDKSSTINKNNRDEAHDKMVNATRMTTMDIGEMVSDWLAMSEELNDNPMDWVKKNVNVRWQFTEPQVELIYSIIKKVWK